MSSTIASGNNNSNSNPLLVVLLDADNFAFPAFSRKPPANSLFHYFSLNPTNSVFLWAFYGANFEKAFKVDLETYVKNTFNEKRNNNKNEDYNNNNILSKTKLPKYLNTWGLLQSRKSVQCTRCEGSSQAADLVIEAVATMLGEEIKNSRNKTSSIRTRNTPSPTPFSRLCLLTGDKGLRNSVNDIWTRAVNSKENIENEDEEDIDDEEQQEEGETENKPPSFFIPDFSEVLTKQRLEENFVLDSDLIWRMVLNGFSTKKNNNNNSKVPKKNAVNHENNRVAQRRQRE